MTKELLIKELDELRKIVLPIGWKIASLHVEFVKTNVDYPADRQRVIYDNTNNIFYVDTTQNGYVYPHKAKGVIEGIEIMRKANNIINQINHKD